MRKNDAANHGDYVKGENLWIIRVADVANRITKKLAAMGMTNVRYTAERNVSPNAKLTLFFNVDCEAALECLPEDVDLVPLRERIKPNISHVDGIVRVEGQRHD